MTALETIVANMTVEDLARKGGCSVETLVARAFGGRPDPDAKASTPPSMPTSKPTNGARSVKGSPESKASNGAKAMGRGKLSLEQALAAVVSAGAPVKLEEVRAKVGGSVPQVRAALKKLAKAGMVRITGERRGTRYQAA